MAKLRIGFSLHSLDLQMFARTVRTALVTGQFAAFVLAIRFGFSTGDRVRSREFCQF